MPPPFLQRSSASPSRSEATTSTHAARPARRSPRPRTRESTDHSRYLREHHARGWAPATAVWPRRTWQLEPDGLAVRLQVDAPSGRHSRHDHQSATLIGVGRNARVHGAAVAVIDDLHPQCPACDLDSQVDTGSGVKDRVGDQLAGRENRGICDGLADCANPKTPTKQARDGTMQGDVPGRRSFRPR